MATQDRAGEWGAAEALGTSEGAPSEANALWWAAREAESGPARAVPSRGGMHYCGGMCQPVCAAAGGESRGEGRRRARGGEEVLKWCDGGALIAALLDGRPVRRRGVGRRGMLSCGGMHGGGGLCEPVCAGIGGGEGRGAWGSREGRRR